MAHNHDASVWDKHSDKWASSVQEITKAPCRELLAMTTYLRPIDKSSHVLDNGAGSGMNSSVILETYPGTKITASDVSSSMIDTLLQNKWPSVNGVVASGMDLSAAGLKDDTFTHSTGTFFLNFTPEPAKCVQEMVRVTQPGGVVALASWHKNTPSWTKPWQQGVREAIDPDWVAPAVFDPKSVEPEEVEKMFRDAGLQDVEMRVVACPHPQQESVDAAVDKFMNMGNPSVQILMRDFSEKQLEVIRPAFAKAYAEIYDGVKKPQAETAILVVGRVP